MVERNGVEYAIVSDDNYYQNDWMAQDMIQPPDYLLDPPKSVSVGGKLGVVKDPFNKLGQQQYLGATLPLDGYGIRNLSLSEDGRVIIGQLAGRFGVDLNSEWKPNLDYVWNVDSLIKAAIEQKDTHINLRHITPQQGTFGAVSGSINMLETLGNTPLAFIGKEHSMVVRPAYQSYLEGKVKGTAFDPNLIVSTLGRMGDVMEVDLFELAARELAKLPMPFDKDGKATKLTASQQDELNKQQKNLTQVQLPMATLRRLLSDTSGIKLAGQIVDDNTVKVLVQKINSPNPEYITVTYNNYLLINAYTKLYFVPNITDQNTLDVKNIRLPNVGSNLSPGQKYNDESLLRAGRALETKAIGFEYSVKQLEHPQGANPWLRAFVGLAAQDFDLNANPFFGDRPLDNPGYSAFTLEKNISSNSTENNPLDVFRVEQRLKYLGIPAMGYGYSQNGVVPDNNPYMSSNETQEFRVDGSWGKQESYAAYMFSRIVDYGKANHRTRYIVGANHSDTATSQDFFGAVDSAASAYTLSQSTPTFSYLNAYNAPHWMKFDTLPGWNNAQTGVFSSSGNVTNIETYGTSWMRDLMVAKNYAPSAFRQNASKFNGATDANYGYTPFGHWTHDLGMAMDLGISQYVKDGMLVANEILHTTVVEAALANPGRWSDLDAQVLLNAMIKLDNNRQDQALGDFLSLYSVTQKGATGSRDALNAQVTGTDAEKQAKLNALFGNGTQSGGLVSGVIVGAPAGTAKQNSYPNMHFALQQLGFTELEGTREQQNARLIPASYPTLQRSGKHHNHFHIYLQPPKAINITQNLHAEPVLQMVSSVGVAQLVDVKNKDKTITGAMVKQIEKRLKNDCVAVGIKDGAGRLNPANLIADALAGLKIKALEPISTRILVKPKQGNLVLDAKPYVANLTVGDIKTFGYDYVPGTIPSADQRVFDRAVFEVKANGKTFKVSYKIIVDEWGFGCDGPENETGPIPGESNFITANNIRWAATISEVDASVNLTSLSSELDDDLFGVDAINFANLPNNAVGQTTGNSITLDTNAAGHGWFIDATPGSNEEFLPTSNPDLWLATAGSAAEGKVDMLSVLMHEYGHLLGLDHSANANDLMGTVLPPGVRKLWSETDLAKLNELVTRGQVSLPALQADTLTRTNGDTGIGSDFRSVRSTHAKI